MAYNTSILLRLFLVASNTNCVTFLLMQSQFYTSHGVALDHWLLHTMKGQYGILDMLNTTQGSEEN